MQDGFDAPSAALSDFPSDPVVHHHVLAWLSVAALLVVATATLTLVYKSAERMARNRLGDGVDARVKAVRKTLEAAARARAGDQVELAQAARAALREHFGGVLELSAHLGKATDGLNKALEGMREEDAKPSSGGAVHGGAPIEGCYVRPALVEMPEQSAVMVRETFAPILYVLRYTALADAIALQNAVPQGLASSIFTTDLREAETFLSAAGSDCGIANVNIGPSGAEIGGAFGGEKETGGGRESGSDAWKAYMRRATNTINFGRTLPLAQGVTFDLV